MTSSRPQGGSSVSARDRSPSLQLAKVADLLARSIRDSKAASTSSIVHLDGPRIRVNTRAVLQPFLNSDFKNAFTPGLETGFVRDMEMPPFGSTARVGGRLLDGSAAATSKAITSLHEAISSELDAALAAANLSELTVSSMEQLLGTLAASISERMPDLPASASMVPVAFGQPGRNADERGQDLARVLSAIETVDGKDWLDALLNGIATRLRNNDVEPEEIDDILVAIRTQRSQPGSQIARFLDFLDDEALSRVRLQVTMRLMEAVAAQSTKEGLKAYVSRTVTCFNAFAGIDGSALTLDISALYGQHNCPQFHEHLRTVGFYSCLPAWPEWSVQLFEGRADASQGFKTKREVSYCFRVNGTNPQTGKAAFDSRLDNIYARVLDEPNADINVKWKVAELVFLWLVVPDSLTNPSSLDVVQAAADVAAGLKRNPLGTLRKLHADLMERCKAMDDVATEMVEVLKTKSTNLIQFAGRSADKFTVAVSRSIVNWEAVESMSSSSTDILVSRERGSDSVEWFNHLTVADSAMVPGSIASYCVEIALQERSLTAAGRAVEVQLRRELQHPVLPIRYLPYTRNNAGEWVPHSVDTRVMDAGVGVDIEYSLKYLQLSRTKDDEKAASEQLRAATVTAFALFVYITLWELSRRVRTATGAALSMTMVRLQHTGKQNSREADAHDANTVVFAISQAIEKALTREMPVKLQGLTTQTKDQNESLRWKRRGALNALLGGQPLNFRMEGLLDKVALVTYVTRPCDTHPSFPDADGFLFQSRTYRAVRENGVATLRVHSMQSRLVESRKDFQAPQLILEEIARLEKDGFEHIMLLSHHFGNRHIGRAAERHAPHGTLQFLDEAGKRFPGVHVYPLRRDVFKATRLRKRGTMESGFEVVNFADHQAMYDQFEGSDLRTLMPIYTFATLVVVGEESRPQSGFCTYFFDAEQRLSNIELKETVRQNILGIGKGEAQNTRASLISVLRAIHFMESEKPAFKTQLLPVLDPFDWASPTRTSAAGEVEIMTRRGSRSVLLSVPAVLAHVTKVLHKDAE
ncbi:hypothetical protein D9X30_0592 [Cupriavidus sp. U2]|uniref:hypothetical protein n=1 Tax=Cupriavidus sp. U2 TaxID=2920269 RepID=UPI001892AAA6|nr:hypothetical protein [Cupriavidus sp. U2]KAI3594360.1 hypothetical protein D9X30_0592 [Cupriavidus sp. U2]